MELTRLKAEIEKLDIPLYPLDHVHVGELVGKDNNMALYEGTRTTDGDEKDVALLVHRKLVSHNTSKKEKTAILKELRDEVLLMGRLKYQPTIVQIVGITFHGSTPIALMELGSAALGVYLRERLEDSRPCSWVEKIWLSFDILMGIIAIHEAGIIHGDLRDSNIFVYINEEGITTAKISVFGSKGFLGSSAPFLAPECTHDGPIQFPDLQGWHSRPPQDIYSYGLLVWLISMDGTRPYKGVENIEAAKAKDPELTEILNKLPENIPPELRAIIGGTTNFMPQDRIPPAEVKTMLRRMLDAFLVEKEVDSGVVSASETPSPTVVFGELSDVDSKLREISENGAVHSHELKAKLSMLRYPSASLPGSPTSFTFTSPFQTPLQTPKTETPLSPLEGESTIPKRQRYKDAKEMFETVVVNGLTDVQRIKSHILPVFQTMLFQDYLEQAEAGKPESQYNVGICYEFGFGGIPSSLTKAFNWYSKAAEGGYFVAQNTLGLCYEKGKGTAVNLALASDWYQRSAQTVLGDIHSQDKDEPLIMGGMGSIPIIDVHPELTKV